MILKHKLDLTFKSPEEYADAFKLSNKKRDKKLLIKNVKKEDEYSDVFLQKILEMNNYKFFKMAYKKLKKEINESTDLFQKALEVGNLKCCKLLLKKQGLKRKRPSFDNSKILKNVNKYDNDVLKFLIKRKFIYVNCIVDVRGLSEEALEILNSSKAINFDKINLPQLDSESLKRLLNLNLIELKLSDLVNMQLPHMKVLFELDKLNPEFVKDLRFELLNSQVLNFLIHKGVVNVGKLRLDSLNSQTLKLIELSGNLHKIQFNKGLHKLEDFINSLGQNVIKLNPDVINKNLNILDLPQVIILVKHNKLDNNKVILNYQTLKFSIQQFFDALYDNNMNKECQLVIQTVRQDKNKTNQLKLSSKHINPNKVNMFNSIRPYCNRNELKTMAKIIHNKK